MSSEKKISPFGVTALLAVAFAALGYVMFTGTGVSYVALAAGALVFYLLLTRELAPLRLPGIYLLFGYAFFSGLTIIWAVAGKFHLREYMKIFLAVAVFLYIVLKERFDAAFVRRVMAVVAGSSAIYAFLSVEAATTGIMAAISGRIPATAVLSLGFNGRLSGVFGNSNIEASTFAFGIIFSIALLCAATERRERIANSVMLSFTAFAFLLGLSLGAMACFAAGIVCYLIFSGERRTSALLRMLEAAIPTAVFAALSTVFFNRSGAAGKLPLLFMLLNAAVTVLLELVFAERFDALLYKHRRIAVGAVLVVLALIVAYALAGYFITGPYTFGDALRRTAYPAAGEHTLVLDADGDVTVTIQSESRMEAAMLTYTVVYEGPASGARFTVPEDSIICYFTFDAAPGTTLRAVSIDGTKKIALDYRLLPDFIASRVQTPRNGQSSVQRDVFREDALKIWRWSPIVGNGVGAYEAAEALVQQFHYETKYVHQHYLQILLEDGVIGFLLWVGALVTMAVLLWKRRRAAADWQYGWAYGALWAGLVFAVLVALWDVSFSYAVTLSYAWALFALICRCCAPEKAAVPEEAKKAKKEKESPRSATSEARLILVLLPALFVGTLCGNLAAGALMNKPVATTDEFFGNLSLAAKLDIYEYNDAKLSYLVSIDQYDATQYVSQGNVYAADMMKCVSNTLPAYLAVYYFNSQQYGEAIDAAMNAVRYANSGETIWNDVTDLMYQGFLENPDTPLLRRPDIYMPRLMAYYQAFLDYNATALRPQEPDERSADFFAKLLAIDACGEDTDKIAAVLGRA